MGDNPAMTASHAYDDPLVIVNLSVWTSLDALREFTYRSDHGAFVRRRREWFVPLDRPAVTLWWVPHGHRPDAAEAAGRLAHLAGHGPTEHAFTFARPFDPPSV